MTDSLITCQECGGILTGKQRKWCSLHCSQDFRYHHKHVAIVRQLRTAYRYRTGYLDKNLATIAKHMYAEPLRKAIQEDVMHV